jgi:5-methylcytosine-specific restriction endonuclease McrA
MATTDAQRARNRETSRRWRAENPERSKANIQRQYENYKKRLAAGLIPKQTEQQKEKARINHKAYYHANKTKALETAKAWQEANPEKVLAAKRKWRLNNIEKQRAATNRWQRTHLVENKIKAGRHRAKKFKAAGFHTPEQLAARVAYYGGKCAYCKIYPYESIDHVIPLTRGGSNWPANLRPACDFCNSSKADLLPHEWVCPRL